MSDHTWKLVEERRSIKIKVSTARMRRQKLLEMEKYNKNGVKKKLQEGQRSNGQNCK